MRAGDAAPAFPVAISQAFSMSSVSGDDILACFVWCKDTVKWNFYSPCSVKQQLVDTYLLWAALCADKDQLYNCRAKSFAKAQMLYLVIVIVAARFRYKLQAFKPVVDHNFSSEAVMFPIAANQPAYPMSYGCR
jgi:hypothetical protein